MQGQKADGTSIHFDDLGERTGERRPLTGPATEKTWWNARTSWQKVLVVLCPLLVLAGVAIAIVMSLPPQEETPPPPSTAKPLVAILFIGDGFGVPAQTMARDMVGQGIPQPLDKYLVGATYTYSANSLITDSAGAATAYACGLKSYNAAIGVDRDGNVCATLLEAAHRRNMATGLVVTSSITHATPAGFSAHVRERNLEFDIARQQIQGGFDVLLGGGRCWFLPHAGNFTCGRPDGRNLAAEVAANGTQVIFNRDQLMNEPLRTPLLGLFAPNHMTWEVDRNKAVEPSLVETLTAALRLLPNVPNKNGVFMMVEGSRIDHAGHANDPVAEVHEVLMYNQAWQTAINWANANADQYDTVVVGVSDHETGGLSLGRSDGYCWKPSVLAAASRSSEWMAAYLLANATVTLQEAFTDWQNVSDLTTAELAALQTARSTSSPVPLQRAVANVMSWRALVGWTTSSHTAADTNIYAYNAKNLGGAMENIAVSHFFENLLQVNLAALTPQINETFYGDLKPYPVYNNPCANFTRGPAVCGPPPAPALRDFYEHS